MKHQPTVDRSRKFTCLLLLAIVLFTGASLSAQIDARLFQQPDVSGDLITFSYGGDIWIVPKSGGNASKLTSPAGTESFPRFSPDGSQIAFSGNYDGNTDIYVIPSQGGVPTRVTHHGMSDRVQGWYPDGKHLLYTSGMESGKQRFSQFYKIPAVGGLPEKLPMAYGEFGSLNADASKIAYTDRSRVFRTWKRYRGGTAADVWLFDLNTLASENITKNSANDELPMWVGDKIYFLSDQGPEQRYNIWMYDTQTKASKQLTKFTEFDAHFPADGPDEIVFEAGGKLHLLDLNTEKTREVNVKIISDLATLRPRVEYVSDYTASATISPDGQRVAVEARGELFSLPAEKGVVLNLSNTSGTAERFPAWSPDGKQLAYWSDKSGEYELTVRRVDMPGKEEKISNLGPGYRYNIHWSPDGKKIAFVDQSMKINVFDVKTKTNKQIDQAPDLFEGGLSSWKASWSKDSKWLAYAKTQSNENQAVMIYDTEAGKLTRATSGFYTISNPTFDREGDFLYVTTDRTFDPVYGDYESTWTYPNATTLGAIALRDNVKSPMAMKNDTVTVKQEEKEKEEDDDKADKKEEADKEADEDDAVKIDFTNFERRLIILSPSAGNMGNLSAADGKVIFHRYPNTGTEGEDNKLMYFDLEEGEEKEIIEDIGGYELSADGKKLLVMQNGKLGVIDFGEDKKMKTALATKDMKMNLVPKEEWRQIFADAWRFERDFFYDKNMHGLDWPAMRQQYGAMIEDALTRDDVNHVLGELIGELNASHTYRGGGDTESGKRRAVGYLGVDWAKENGQFKIAKIVRGADWDTEVRSPFDEPGIGVKEGDYVLAVNGTPLADFTDPWAAFEGLSNETVQLTVGSSPEMAKANTVLVKTLGDETRLRNLAWINENRMRVDEASNGKLGYVYVPSTGYDGQNELVRQFYGQWDKEGLIIDERFNNGGQIPDRFIELLNRKPLAFWDVRDGENWQWPSVAHFGSMAMLINGWAGSGGDAFPDFFRKAGLGPLIGGRTWGGLIGISGAPSFVDGGSVTVPTFRMYNPDGTWFKEGHGVDPDIEVLEDPTQLAKGVDTQLERAIEEVLRLNREKNFVAPGSPKVEDRAGARVRRK